MKLYRKKGSPYWYGRCSVGGKDRWVSSKETKKKQAEKIIERKLAVLKGTASIDNLFNDLMLSLDGLPEDERTQKRQKYAKVLMGGSSSQLSIGDAWETWINSPLKRNPGQETIRMYHAVWKRFCTWASKQGIEYLHDVTPGKAQDYCTELWKSKITGNTYNKHLLFLRSMFKTLSVKGGLADNPWTDIPSMVVEKEGRRSFSPEELQRICSTAKGNLRYMLGIGIYTGLRLGDVISLQWREVNLDKEIIERVPSKTRRKGRILRIPIHPVLLSLLEELQVSSDSKFLFPQEFEQYQKNRSNLSKNIQSHLRNCGIKTTEEPKGNRKVAVCLYGFHSLRHSFVSLCAANRVPRAAVMELVGHNTVAMNSLYSHAGSEQKVAAIASLPAIGFESKAE